MLTESNVQNVLLIGAGTSSTNIARELSPEASRIYQASRGGAFDLPPCLLPSNATRIDEIAGFESPPAQAVPLDDPFAPFPFRILLKSGAVLTNIHRIIVCTGYHISLPFLYQYHDDNTPIREANDTILVTDGTQVHNLHKDIFYIPDPSLLFIGIPFYTATFTLFEFQAMVAAAVLSGQAVLPAREDMRKEYDQKVRRKGTGRAFHSLKDKEVEYVDDLLSWVNRDRAKIGAEPLAGHTQAWHVARADHLERVRKIFGQA